MIIINRKLFTSILVAALLFVTMTPAFAETPQQSMEETVTPEAVDAFLDQFFTDPQIQTLYNGAAVVIVKGDEVLAQKGYGYANVEQEQLVDPEETIFRIASVSKTFTAVAIMQLVEQGKIDLNENIATYLPEIQIENPFATPITTAHLLTHESGLEVRDPQQQDLHTDFEHYVSIEEYIDTHMPPVVREPGTSYMYDNFGYLLLGLIVQNVSEQPYEEYMEEHIFQPLRMENSSLELKTSLLEQVITGYEGMEPIEPYTTSPTIMPHGGMLATADDIAKFMLAFLNDGKTPDGELLTEESIEAMIQYRSYIHPLLPNTTYGFEALTQLPLAGSSEQIITKAGDLPGNSSLLMFIPDHEIGIFLSYNQNGPLREYFYGAFIATFFPELLTPAELTAFEPIAAEELEAYAGYYSDLRLKSIISHVSVSGDGMLTITDAFLGPRQLYQVDEHLFVDELTQNYTAFQIDENNQTVYMKEPYLNPLGYARQGESAVGYVDLDGANEYGPYILALQSLGIFPNEQQLYFLPEQQVTRAELVQYLVTTSGLDGSASEQYAFADIAEHSLAPYIQTAAELGMVVGDGNGLFHPDRSVTRQEAAVMVWNIYRHIYPQELFEPVVLDGETSEWAVPAVKMAVTFGFFGPEVTVNEQGSVNYYAKETMTRQQAAAFLHQLLLQPVEQIVASLMSQ